MEKRGGSVGKEVDGLGEERDVAVVEEEVGKEDSSHEAVVPSAKDALTNLSLPHRKYQVRASRA